MILSRGVKYDISGSLSSPILHYSTISEQRNGMIQKYIRFFKVSLRKKQTQYCQTKKLTFENRTVNYGAGPANQLDS